MRLQSACPQHRRVTRVRVEDMGSEATRHVVSILAGAYVVERVGLVELPNLLAETDYNDVGAGATNHHNAYESCTEC